VGEGSPGSREEEGEGGKGFYVTQLLLSLVVLSSFSPMFLLQSSVVSRQSYKAGNVTARVFQNMVIYLTHAILAEFAFHKSDERCCSRHFKPEARLSRRLSRKLLPHSLYRDFCSSRVIEDTSVAQSSLAENSPDQCAAVTTDCLAIG
jgi:hypothetical protein